MGHAIEHNNTCPFFKGFVSYITIGLQITFKIFEYIIGAFPATATAVIKQGQLCNAVMITPVVALMRSVFFRLTLILWGVGAC